MPKPGADSSSCEAQGFVFFQKPLCGDFQIRSNTNLWKNYLRRRWESVQPPLSALKRYSPLHPSLIAPPPFDPELRNTTPSKVLLLLTPHHNPQWANAQRRDESIHRSPLIFEDSNWAQSLAVQYFQQSSHHQRLRHRIETAASLERTREREELAKKTQEYRYPIQEINSSSHEEGTKWHNNHEIPYQKPHCEEYRLKEQADDLSINVHEWPHPYIELEARSTVFELDVPPAISKWRDITYTLLVDVFSCLSSRHEGNLKGIHTRPEVAFLT